MAEYCRKSIDRLLAMQSLDALRRNQRAEAPPVPKLTDAGAGVALKIGLLSDWLTTSPPASARSRPVSARSRPVSARSRPVPTVSLPASARREADSAPTTTPQGSRGFVRIKRQNIELSPRVNKDPSAQLLQPSPLAGVTVVPTPARIPGPVSSPIASPTTTADRREIEVSMRSLSFVLGPRAPESPSNVGAQTARRFAEPRNPESGAQREPMSARCSSVRKNKSTARRRAKRSGKRGKSKRAGRIAPAGRIVSARKPTPRRAAPFFLLTGSKLRVPTTLY